MRSKPIIFTPISFKSKHSTISKWGSVCKLATSKLIGERHFTSDIRTFRTNSLWNHKRRVTLQIRWRIGMYGCLLIKLSSFHCTNCGVTRWKMYVLFCYLKNEGMSLFSKIFNKSRINVHYWRFFKSTMLFVYQYVTKKWCSIFNYHQFVFIIFITYIFILNSAVHWTDSSSFLSVIFSNHW